MKKILSVVIVAAFGYLLYNHDFDFNKLTDKISGTEATYTPIKKTGPLPKEIFGLKNSGNGIWRYSNGEVAYKQARVYQGGSKSIANKIKRDGECTYQKEVVTVTMDSNKYPASALHIYIAARAGVPEVLHINRDPGYDIRLNSLEGIESNSKYDRDESPFAMSNEAAVYNKSKGTSDIAFIPFSDNRGSGSSLGGQLSEYCDGQAFRINLSPSK
jgi:hypothetical protein